MGAAVVRGVQEHMMACTKHFTGNSIDLSRHYVDVKMDERTLREVYLPHFKACVDAGTASIMSAYNQLNGHLCGHNKYLLRDVLKREWGFDGFVISDFGLGIKDTVKAANGGCDVEMDRRVHYDWKLKVAVKLGLVPIEHIDDAVLRQTSKHLEFIHLEEAKYDLSKVGGPDHAALAREVEQKAIVLLKNESGVLPISRDEVKTVAVIGSLAAEKNLGATGSTSFTPSYAITPLQGVKKAAGGSIEVIYEHGADLAAVKRAAQKADAVVVVAGLTFRDENEGSDRLKLDLPEDQERMILEAAAANPRCVVVLEGGGAITMEAWKDAVPAILMAWYPGMEGGSAIADVLFGDVNPSGKLPIAFPKSKDQLPEFNNISPVVRYDSFHGYRWLDKKGIEPAFPFGFGLSYTEYEYSNLRLSHDEIGKNGTLTVECDVANRGAMAGEEVVQLYVGYDGSAVDRPIKELKSFSRVSLRPGEAKTVSMKIEPKDLAYYNVEKRGWEVEEIGYDVMVGPSSRTGDLLSARFRVSGA
jgi:beta-glucosidase